MSQMATIIAAARVAALALPADTLAAVAAALLALGASL